MQNQLGWQYRLLVVCGAAFLAFLVVLGANYRLYIFSMAWHCTHRNHQAKVGKFDAKLPMLWWEEESDEYDTVVLRRASPTSTFPLPEIIVRPALSGVTHKTDQEVLASMQKLIAAKDKHPALGASSSLVVIGTKKFPLYCEKTDTNLLGMDISNQLFCMTANVPYVFTYDGPPNREKEAESILVTLE